MLHSLCNIVYSTDCILYYVDHIILLTGCKGFRCVSSTDKYISDPLQKDINVINVISRQYGSQIITFTCHGFKNITINWTLQNRYCDTNIFLKFSVCSFLISEPVQAKTWGGNLQM